MVKCSLMWCGTILHYAVGSQSTSHHPIPLPRAANYAILFLPIVCYMSSRMIDQPCNIVSFSNWPRIPKSLWVIDSQVYSTALSFQSVMVWTKKSGTWNVLMLRPWKNGLTSWKRPLHGSRKTTISIAWSRCPSYPISNPNMMPLSTITSTNHHAYKWSHYHHDGYVKVEEGKKVHLLQAPISMTAAAVKNT